MTSTLRIDPRRASSIGPSGLPRMATRKRVTAEADQAEKPVRALSEPKHWHMAIAHSDRGSLDEHARQAIAAAALLAGPETGVIAVVFGELNDDLAQAGADVVAALPDFDVSRFQPERELAMISTLVQAYAPQHIFMPDAARGDGDLGRRLIAHLSARAATRVAELDAGHVSIHWSPGAALANTALPQVLLLDAGAVDSELPFVGAGKRLDPAAVPAAPIIAETCRDLGLENTGAGTIALEEADFIVSAGYGVRNVATLQALAQSLGAAVGASRVAVDEGWFPRDRQIGATGKTVSASAYIAVGISGAVQHLQGIKDCRHVIAINKDAGAPIAKRADLTIIGDAEDVMQALITRIAQARAQSEVPGEVPPGVQGAP